MRKFLLPDKIYCEQHNCIVRSYLKQFLHCTNTSIFAFANLIGSDGYYLNKFIDPKIQQDLSEKMLKRIEAAMQEQQN